MEDSFYIRRDPDKVLESLEEGEKTAKDLTRAQKEKILKYEKLFFAREELLKKIKVLEKNAYLKSDTISALEKEILDFLGDFKDKVLKWGRLVYKLQAGGTKKSQTYKYKDFEEKAYEILARLSEDALNELKEFKETIYKQVVWEPYLDVEKKPESPEKVAPEAKPKVKRFSPAESIGILAESRFGLFKKFYTFLATKYNKWKKDLAFAEKYINSKLG